MASPSLLTGIKLETIGRTKLAKPQNGKIGHVLIGITQLVIKYFLEKMVSSAKVRVDMNVTLGLSHQLIQMELAGFNAEQNLKDVT